MANCSCGAESHMDQIEKYPVGAKVFISLLGSAIVREHCDDGRASFLLDNGEVHTFHGADSWVISAELPPVDARDAKIAELEAEIARTKDVLRQMKALNYLRNDLDAYLLALAEHGIDEAFAKPEPLDFGVDWL